MAYGLAAALSSCLASSSFAETAEVRFAQLYGLAYLPAYVVYEEKLIEKHAARLGIPAPKVSTAKLSSGPASNDALIAGSVDIAMGGITVLMTLWEKTRGSLDVRGVTSLCESQIFLLTVDPRIKSIKDLGPSDRIAVSAVKVTMQALLLNLAAAREWGWDERFRLDPLAVSMSHPLSIAALRSGNLELKNYAAIVPYNYELIGTPNVRQLLTSYDVFGGPHSTAAMWATGAWVKANPKTYEAVVAAFVEAMDRIEADREAAARTYIKWETSTLQPNEVARIISTSTDIKFSAAPSRSMMIAETMHKVGLLKKMPAAWTDYFHPALHVRSGS